MILVGFFFVDFSFIVKNYNTNDITYYLVFIIIIITYLEAVHLIVHESVT